MLDHDLCPGKQHCQEGTPQFIGSCVRQLETLKLHGRCLIPEIEVNTYWTNLPCTATEVTRLYHDHGTSEQFHSELKSYLNIE
jgi:hypothetical protein